ncbi:MAG TPA: helix-turn-helix domain-containing protein, partial [Micromonosporaceae bacterium]
MTTSRRDQTTRRILDGAAATFAKGGYAATSMEEIAAAAGVSKLLLYRDFAGKRELYRAVLARTQEKLTARVESYASNESLRSVLAVARADPDGFTLLYRHAAREPEFAAYANTVTDEFERMAERILRDVEPDRVLRRWAAEMTVTITFQAIIAWLEHGDPDRDDEFFERLLAIAR